MARIVAVHGIAQQGKGPNWIHDDWFKALADGLRYHDVVPAPGDLYCPVYSDLFRERVMALEEEVDEADLTDDELALVDLVWAEAARVDPDNVIAPDARAMGVRHRAGHVAFEALSYSPRLTNLVMRGASFFYGSLKQVTAYMTNPEIRRQARALVAQAITPDTRVVIGHSLGSVVAYEVLCQHKASNIPVFVTLGSPLGIRNLIFHRLDPAPVAGVGCWPECVETWSNFADRNDIVALSKALAPWFGERVVDHLVDNDLSAHEAKYYLTDRRTGEAIARGLAG